MPFLPVSWHPYTTLIGLVATGVAGVIAKRLKKTKDEAETERDQVKDDKIESHKIARNAQIDIVRSVNSALKELPKDQAKKFKATLGNVQKDSTRDAVRMARRETWW